MAGASAPQAAAPSIIAEPLFGSQAGALISPALAAEPGAASQTAAPSAPSSPAAASPATATAEATQSAPNDTAKAPASDGIVVFSKPRPTKADPLAPLNAEVFGVTMSVDAALTGPAAMAYARHVPEPFRLAMRHFINNLDEPVITINFLIQLKPGKAVETLGRFAINSTIGLAGFIDVAKKRPFNLPKRPNGFADTFGYYGVKPGPYFYLPLIGPTTLRDLVGGAFDMAVLPRAVGTPFNKVAFTLPTGMIDALDYRANFEAELQKMRAEPTDLYRARRAYYLHQRQAQIEALHGRTSKAFELPRPLSTPPASK